MDAFELAIRVLLESAYPDIAEGMSVHDSVRIDSMMCGSSCQEINESDSILTDILGVSDVVLKYSLN